MIRVLFAFCLLAGLHPALAALPGAEPLAKLIAKEFDTNSDDLLDAGEWQKGIADGFAKLDSNGDASIRSAEVDDLKDDIVGEVGDFAGVLIVGLIKQVLMALDNDGDKVVSREEYDKLATDIFTRLDGDKDASLTLPELAELPVKLLAK